MGIEPFREHIRRSRCITKSQYDILISAFYSEHGTTRFVLFNVSKRLNYQGIPFVFHFRTLKNKLFNRTKLTHLYFINITIILDI